MNRNCPKERFVVTMVGHKWDGRKSWYVSNPPTLNSLLNAMEELLDYEKGFLVNVALRLNMGPTESLT